MEIMIIIIIMMIIMIIIIMSENLGQCVSAIFRLFNGMSFLNDLTLGSDDTGTQRPT